MANTNTDIEIATPAKTFRGMASDRMKAAAGLSLHELVDEFLRLTAVMEANALPTTKEEDDWGSGSGLNEVGELASRERAIFDGAAKVRFGISFHSYDSKF